MVGKQVSQSRAHFEVPGDISDIPAAEGRRGFGSSVESGSTFFVMILHYPVPVTKVPTEGSSPGFNSYLS